MIRTLPIPRTFSVNASPRPRLPQDVEKRVEKIWQARQALSPSLFNGEIFAVEKISEDQVRVQLTEYRYCVAQWQEPDLYPQIKIETLAVAGVLRTDEGVVWGRRSLDSNQYPGAWELIPSGGVDGQSRTDDGLLQPVRQMILELQEEAGLKESQIARIRPVCFLEDSVRRVYFLCLEIESRLSFGEIKKLHEALPLKEHSELILTPFSELESFLEEGKELADFNRVLLAECGLL